MTGALVERDVEQDVEQGPALEEARAHPGRIIFIGCFCGIVVALTQTMVVPLVPLLPGILHASAADASWALTATLLGGAVSMPIAGRLGDMFGKRLALIGSLLLLLLGSLICALTASLVPVVVGRSLQGLSLGTVALGISIMRDELPPARVGKAVAQMSSTLGVGAAFAMPISALVVQRFNWHALFWVSAALAAVAVAAVVLLVPESPVRTPGRFDFLGALGLSAGLILILMGITKVEAWGWSSGRTLGMFAAGLVVLLLWGFWETRASSPLVDLAVSAKGQVLFTNIASIGVGFALYGMSLIPIQLLLAPAATGFGSGLTLVQAGFVLMPSGLGMYAMSGLGAKLTAARGARVSLMVGTSVVALGYVVLLLTRDHWYGVMAATLLSGSGVGMAYAAMPALIMSAVPVSETAAANGLNALMRSLGTSSASAVVATVLASHTIAVGTAAFPSDHAINLAVGVCLGACALAITVAAFIPSPRPSR